MIEDKACLNLKQASNKASLSINSHLRCVFGTAIAEQFQGKPEPGFG
jgi:hypothetical protein